MIKYFKRWLLSSVQIEKEFLRIQKIYKFQWDISINMLCVENTKNREQIF